MKMRKRRGYENINNIYKMIYPKKYAFPISQTNSAQSLNLKFEFKLNWERKEKEKKKNKMLHGLTNPAFGPLLNSLRAAHSLVVSPSRALIRLTDRWARPLKVCHPRVSLCRAGLLVSQAPNPSSHRLRGFCGPRRTPRRCRWVTRFPRGTTPSHTGYKGGRLPHISVS
jgi:hypothetical protein